MLNNIISLRAESRQYNDIFRKVGKFFHSEAMESLTSDEIVACHDTVNWYVESVEFGNDFICTVAHAVDNDFFVCIFERFPYIFHAVTSKKYPVPKAEQGKNMRFKRFFMNGEYHASQGRHAQDHE